MRIKTLTYSLLVITLALFVTSCQKEISADTLGNSGNGNGNGGNGGNNTNNIAGDYDYVGMLAHTVSTVTATQAGMTMKAVTTANYNTISNLGTVKITANQMISTGVGYSVDTTINSKTYIDGVLVDNSDVPFTFTSPPTSATSNYVRNSADSITMQGGFGVPDPTGGSTPVGDIGAKLSWHGDTLFMKVNTTVTKNITQAGVPATLVATIDATSKLKKH